MPTAKTTAKKPAAAKVAPKKEAATVADVFALPKLEIPGFEMPSMELPENPVPEMVREFTEQSVAKARESYEKARATAEEQNAAIEKSLDTARESTMAMNKKALDAAQANVEAGFDFAREILGAKTLGDAIEMQTAFARKQFDAMSAQAKDFQESMTKSIDEVSAPVKKAAEKAMEDIKAA